MLRFLAIRPRRHSKVRRRGVPPVAPPQAAAHAGLRYVSDAASGIRRRRHGKGFRYEGPDGTPLRAAA